MPSFKRRNKIGKWLYFYRITVYHTNYNVLHPRKRKIFCDRIWTFKLDDQSVKEYVKSKLKIGRLSIDYKIEYLELDKQYFSMTLDEFAKQAKKIKEME